MFDSIVHSKLYSSLYIHCFTVNLYTNSQYSNNPPPHPFIPCIHYVPFPLHTWYKLYPHPFIPCIHFIIPASTLHTLYPHLYLAYTIPFPLHTLYTLYHSRFITCIHYTPTPFIPCIHYTPLHTFHILYNPPF